MDIIFSKILSMSLSASFVIAAVLLLRFLLKKAPKKYSYFLWLLVFFRLLCPVSIESSFSLIPINEDSIIYQYGTDGSSIKVNTGMEKVDWMVNHGIMVANQKLSSGDADVGNEAVLNGSVDAGSEAASSESVDAGSEAASSGSVDAGSEAASMEDVFAGSEAASMEGAGISTEEKAGFLDKVFFWMMILWITGVILLIVVNIFQILHLRWKLRTAVLVTPRINRNGNKNICSIYESEYIQTAFLLGIIRPRIYLPLGIEEEQGYVVTHEMMHKRRGDYLVKPICYLAAILHWFNPLVWLSFYLMTKDMEMSCDEQVLKNAIEDIRSEYSKDTIEDIRREYSKCLLNVSIKGSGLSIPLAFGESNTKERIKHVLKYKKPSTWIGIGAIVVLFAAAVLLLTTNTEGGNDSWQGNIVADSQGNAAENSQGTSSEDNQKDAEEDTSEEWQKAGAITVNQEQEMEAIVDNLISQAIIKYAKTQFEKEGNHVEAHAILGGEEYVFQQMAQSDKEMVFYILARDSIMGKLAYNAVENVTEYDKVTGYDNAAEYQKVTEYDNAAEYQKVTGYDNAAEYQKVTEYDNATEYSSTVKEIAGIVFPAKVTIAITEDGSMEVTDFWIPQEGAYMEDDIKENFPEEFWDAALYMEGYREQLQEKLLEKAIIQLDE